MKHRDYPTHPALRESIKCYWSHEELHTLGTEEHTLVPDSYVELSFCAGDVLLERARGGLLALPCVHVMGLRDAPSRMVSRGMTRVLGVRFYAWGALRLLGLQDGLGGFSSAGTTLLGLSERVVPMLEQGAYTDAIGLIEAWLLERNRDLRGEAAAVETAGRELYASSGQARVGDLARMLGLSARQFQRRFKLGAGVPPKALARLIRFEGALGRLMLDPNASLTELAFDLGYADQAHFIRDFRAFAHQTPSAFAASVRRSHWFASLA